MTMTKIDTINIQRTDNGYVIDIIGESECGDWADEKLSIVGDSFKLAVAIAPYTNLPRRT